jgi:hypothetical protein
MNETTLSRVLTARSAHDVWLTLRQTLRGHASTALAYENEIHQPIYKDGTSIEEHSNSFRQLVVQYHAVGGTMSDVNVALAMLQDSTTQQPTRESSQRFKR